MLRTRWAPPETARLNLTHPLASGLGGVGVGGVAHLPGKTSAAAFAPNPTPLGLGWACPMNGGIRLCQFPAQDDGTCFTLAAVAWISSEGVTQRAGTYIGYRNGGGPGLSFIKLSQNVPPNQNQTVFGYYSNGSNRGVSVTGTAPRTPVIVGVKQGLTLSVWEDGILGQSQTYTTGQLTVSAANCYYGSDEALTCFPVAGWFWPNRALTQSEIAAFSTDPFEMFTG